MQRGFTALIMLALPLAIGAYGSSLEFDNTPSEVATALQAADHTILNIHISSLDYSPVVMADSQEAVSIFLPEVFGQGRGAYLGPGNAVIPTITRLLAVPFDADPSFRIVRQEYADIPEISLAPAPEEDLQSFLAGGETPFSQAGRPLVTGEIAGVMRDLRLYALTISPVQYDPANGSLRVYTDLEIEVSHAGAQTTRYGDHISEAFAPIYRSLVDNPAVFDPVRVTRGAYWVLYPDVFASQMQPFIDWKKAKGFDVVAITQSQLGSNTYINIRNYILARFDSCQNKPDYIAIMGDVAMPSGPGIATKEYPNPHGFGDIESDNYYSFLHGNDYFPELLIGRISFDNQAEIGYYLSKIFRYERTPYMTDMDWYHRGVVVAGSDGYSFTSPRFTKLWCREAMMERGFTQVDTFFAENGGWELPAQISAAINAGVGYVNYRGYGTAYGWTPPDYTSYNISALSNANKYPVMTSLVCGTGDYNDPSYDVCMGETWIRANNKGGVGFIGNSNHDAHTRWTNALDVGIYWGWFDEDVTTLAQAQLMGKMTLYNGFPADRSTNGQVELYFNSYNILGDPEVNCWTDIPRPMLVDHPDSLEFGQNRLDVHIQDSLGTAIEGAAICIWKGAEVFASGFTNAAGDFEFMASPLTPGYMKVTATAKNRIPYEDSLYYYTSGAVVGYASHTVDDDSNGESQGDGDGVLNPSERVELPVQLMNFGSTDTAYGVTATLSCQMPGITISRSVASYGNIAPGESSAPDQPFLINAGSELPDGATARMIIDVTDVGGHVWQNVVNLPVAAGNIVADTVMILDGLNGRLDPGELAEMAVQAVNVGGDPLMSASAVLRTSDDQAHIIDSMAVIGDCLPGDTISNIDDHFAVLIDSDIYVGHIINFTMTYTGLGPQVVTSSFGVQVGQVQQTDPVGPDNYGYYCFDNIDTTYLYRPNYDWIDINTAWTYVSLSDDDVATIDLPFPVLYYGQVFDEITICDNGFAAFGRTWWPNFYNGPIPAPQNAMAMVAPFWDDFVQTPMRVYYNHDEVNGQFIIGWRNAYDSDNSRNQTFEIIILDNAFWPSLTGDNEIIFQYQTATTVTTMSAGICSPDRTDGICINFNGTRPAGAAQVSSGRAVKFTTGSLYMVGADDDGIVPGKFAVGQNYPNPFNGATQIEFSLPSRQRVTIDIFNILGQRITTLADREFDAGSHTVSWNAVDVTSGIYFYRLATLEGMITKRMTLLK